MVSYLHWNVSEPCKGTGKKVAPHDRAEDDRGVQTFNLPSSNPYFTGRDTEIEEIHKQLKAYRKAALYGLGGMGKTQTIAEYLDRYQTAYEWIFWVNADESTLAASFGNLAEIAQPGITLKLDEQIEAVERWLRTQTDSVLLIFDNADEPELLKPYLPSNPSVRVLLTSRASVFDGLGIANPIALEKLTSDQSVEFLFKRTGRSMPPEKKTDPEFKAAEELAHELGGLPLALEQAGAYILAKKASFKVYLASFLKQRLELLGKQAPKLGDSKKTVSVTWNINFEAVQVENLAAAEVLRLSAFLAPEAIPYELLILGAAQLGDVLRVALANAAEDGLVLLEMLESLTRYSLIQIEIEKNCYNLHRLVQEVLRDRLEISERQQWVERSVEALAEAFPSGKFETWGQCDRLLTHMQSIRQHLRHYSYGSIPLSMLLNAAGFYLKEQERYEEALELYKEALKVCEDLSLESLDQETRRKLLAELLDQQALEEIQQMLGENFAGLSSQQMIDFLLQQPFVQQPLKEKLSVHFPNTTTILNNLAEMHNALGHYDNAEELYLQVIKIDRERLGNDHPDVATTLNNLALTYESQGRHSEAELLYKQALTIRERTIQEQRSGVAHSDVAQVLNNLAVLYKRQRRYTEAEKLYKRALTIRKQQLGTHPDTALVLNNLAELYKKQERYEEAEPLFKEALAMRRRLGVSPLATARSLTNLAELYELQKRYGEAEPVYQESLEIQEKKLGDKHPDVAEALTNLAECYRNHRQCYGKAKILYDQALKIWQTGNNYSGVAKTLNNLALLYEQQGNYAQAAPSYDQALTILFSSGGNDSLIQAVRDNVQENVSYFLLQVIAAGRTADLSNIPRMKALLDHTMAQPQTPQLIQQIRANLSQDNSDST